MSQNEIMKDLAEKEKILRGMVKNNIRKLNDVGEVIQNYYINPEKVFKK